MSTSLRSRPSPALQPEPESVLLPTSSYDLVVIGGGPGGYTAAVRAAQLGMEVALVELGDSLGGTCLHWGCIPTKALLSAADAYRQITHADVFGLSVGEVGVDWKQVVSRSRAVPVELARGLQHLMKKNRIEVVRGRGRLSPSKQVQVCAPDGTVVTSLATSAVMVASGARPRSLPGVEVDGTRVWSSCHALVAEDCPESLAVIGAGPIGVEFADLFSTFGCRVSLLEAEEQILPGEDPEISGILAQSLSAQGIEVRTGVKVAGVSPSSGTGATRVRCHPSADGASHDDVETERVLVAVGVTGNVEDLGLGAVGVRVRDGVIEVDERFETSASGVYAVGDVIGPPQLAHAASAEAVAAVELMAGHRSRGYEPAAVPRCVFCHPQVASVGLTLQQAESAGHDVAIGRFPFQASGKARSAAQAEGLVKLLFGRRYGEVLGAAMVGPQVTELISQIGMAIQLEATYEELIQTIHAHPTLSEVLAEAAGAAYGQAIHI